MEKEFDLRNRPTIFGDYNLRDSLNKLKYNLSEERKTNLVKGASKAYTKHTFKVVKEKNIENFDKSTAYLPQYVLVDEEELLALFVITPVGVVIMVDLDKERHAQQLDVRLQ